jgi:uncharacterized membrane protein
MLIVLVGDLIGIGTVASMLGHKVHEHSGGYRWPITPTHGMAQCLALFVITGFLLAGMFRMASNQLRGRTPRIEDLFTITDVWLDVLLASLLYGVAFIIGSWFCLIPGWIAAGLFMFALPLVVEAKLPATGAMIQSWHALKSEWLKVTVLHFVLFVLAGAGIVLFGIGVFVTGPLYCLSIALLYRDFFPHHPKAAWKSTTDPFAEI